MDQFLTALISPLVILLGGAILSGFGVVLGGAARYGLPPLYRSSGGWVLAGSGAALMLTLVAVATIDQPARAGWIYAAALLAIWLPGFAAASLGAQRWGLICSVPVGMVLAYGISLSFGGLQ